MNKTIKAKTGYTINVEVLNPDGQKASNFVYNYLVATHYDLRHCYANPSQYMLDAYDAIFSEYCHCRGTDIRITGANSCTFSCAYTLEDCDNTRWIIYHTHCNVYGIRLG